MRNRRRYIPNDSMAPLLGLDSTSPSTMISPSISPALTNVLLDEGVIRKRDGYFKLGMGIVSFTVTINKTGTWNAGDSLRNYVGEGDDWEGTLVSITATNVKVSLTSGVYTDVATADGIDNVTRNEEILTGNITSKAELGTLATTVGNATEDVLAMIDFENESGTRYLLAVSETKICYLDLSVYPFFWSDFPDGSSLWAADKDNPVDWVSFSGLVDEVAGKYLLITNGIRGATGKVIFWEGDTGVDLEDFSAEVVGGGVTNFTSCRTLEVYYDRVFLGNTYYHTGTVTNEVEVLFSDVADADLWTTELSGSAEFTDLDGEILTLKKLGDRLVVYTENEIGIILYVGGEAQFSFKYMYEGTKLMSWDCICDVGPFHLLLTKRDILFYYGTNEAPSVGGRIRQTIEDNVDLDNDEFAFAFHDYISKRCYFSIPTSATASILLVGEYNFQNKMDIKWVQHSHADRPVSMGTFIGDQELAWNSTLISTMTWADMQGSWDQESYKTLFPQLVFGSSATDAYNFAEDVLNDDGDTITCEWESIDFATPDYLSRTARWIEIEAELKGVDVDVDYSTDKGLTWTSISSQKALSSKWASYRFCFDTTARTMRIRLSCSRATSTFSFRWLRLWFMPGSDR